jgi:hypothetical protein
MTASAWFSQAEQRVNLVAIPCVTLFNSRKWPGSALKDFPSKAFDAFSNWKTRTMLYVPGFVN